MVVLQTKSLHSLRLLCGALHVAIATTLCEASLAVTDSAVFNTMVVSCLAHVPGCLNHHLPPTTCAKPRPPSSHASWHRVKRTVKQYLSDLLSLLHGLQDSTMQCAVLKQVQTLSAYWICFPKLVKTLNKTLVERWTSGESHVQVLAFLSLRKLVILRPHPALHELLKVWGLFVHAEAHYFRSSITENVFGICSQLQIY